MAKRARDKLQPALPLGMPEGVHLRLPQQVYFDMRALGSSDFSTLAADPKSWWYGSPFNLDKRGRKKRRAELAFGSALHALTLEGEDAYRERFVIQPDAESSLYVRGRDAARALLREKGIEIPRGDFENSTLWGLIRRAGLQGRVWEVAEADFIAARKAGKDLITEDENRRLRHMAQLVADHQDFGPGLRGGLSEVSVFWRREERPDVLLRARFDKLLPGVDLDLKSFTNRRGIDPDDATFDALAEHDYDLQAEHYRDAHVQMRRFVKAGQVFAWTPDSGADNMLQAQVLADERKLLEQISAVERWRWGWLFYQTRNDNEGQEQAPVIVPWWTWPEGQMFDDARVVIERALSNYEASVAEFGLHKPWSEIREFRQLPADRLRRLSFKRRPPQ